MQDDVEMCGVLLGIAKKLTEFPDRVHVQTRSSEKCAEFTITVASADVGRVLGKQGRTARAIRIITTAWAQRHDRTALVHIDCEK